MSELIVFNGNQYVIPVPDDIDWGQNVTDFLVAIPAGCLQKTGGSFTLTADVDFGANFGLISAYFRSRSANVATAGMIRLANTDLVEWRNVANSGNNTLGVNGADQLVYNGTPLEFNALPNGQIFVGSAGGVATAQPVSGDIALSNAGVTIIQSGVISNGNINAGAAIAYSKLNLSGQIVNSDIFSSAAIAYSKLNLTTSIVNGDINASAAIAYSKLNLTGSILNADISASAAISLSKLAALTANRVLLSDGSGFASASTVTNVTLGFLDATSSIQTQLNAKQATGNYLTALTGDVTASGPGSSAATLATVNSNVGSFTLASITVNAKGLITAASNGSAGAGTVTSVTGTTNQITVATGTTTPVIAIANPVTFPGAMTAGGALAMGGNKITGQANGTVSTDSAAYGQVQQLAASVQVVNNSSFTTTSNAYQSTNLTGSITPSSSSSRVKITVSGTLQVGTSLSTNAFLSVFRGSTNLAVGGNAAFCVTDDQSSTANAKTPCSVTFIDSPATAVSTTYTVKIHNDDNTTNVIFGGASDTILILEEIR